MPFVSRRELARIERERAGAIKRAEVAESRLEAERERCFQMVMRAASRLITKGGEWGIEELKPLTQSAEQPTRALEISEEEFYRECREDGLQDSEIHGAWETYQRTGLTPYELRTM